jgi:peptidoglycan/xylan/chitin deacetylase (PgdA/CDA1 family)
MAHELDRRALLGVLALGTAAALTGCARRPAVPLATPEVARPVARDLPVAPVPVAVRLDQFPAPVPGPPEIHTKLPLSASPSAVALTIDDGFSPQVVAAYVEFAQSSGVHLTFNPNGLYDYAWGPHAAVLRPLVAAGQVQLGNHTFSHKDVRHLSRRALRKELEKNEDWIQRTFGVTSRPWFRPPYGFRTHHSDEVAADLGWTNVLMWDGSFGDAAVLTPEVLLQQAELYLKPGAIVLGHANHPAVTEVYPQLLELISSRQLTMQTLDEAFGTSRAVGAAVPLPGPSASPSATPARP